jgi:hypothetical protein
MEEKQQKKKRGRKPKKIVEEPEKEEVSAIQNSNLVIKLTEPKQQIGGDEGECVTLGYEGNSANQTKYGEQKTGDVCWNCCHEFNNIITGIPMKYKNGIFYTYGDFCCLECCARYAYEYFKEDYWEILSNINLYNKQVFGTTTPIEMAPSKLVLKKFGGKLTIDEYRQKKNIYEIQLPPILPINHLNTMYEKKMNNQFENLKLYRKKKLPSDKKSITQTMNLQFS